MSTLGRFLDSNRSITVLTGAGVSLSLIHI